MRIAATVIACVVAPMVAQAAQDDHRIAVLAAEATALKARGESAPALERARAALALAEATPGPRSENLYVALAALAPALPEPDMAQQYDVYQRLAAVAAVARGPDSYVALEARTSRNLLAFVFRKPGGTLANVAEPLARATPLARTDAERTRVAGLTLALAQFYDATGDHDKAVAIVASVAHFFDTAPTVPNLDYVPSLTTLARRYIAWEDWPRALDAADRAIAASVSFLGARTFRIAQPLDARGMALAALGRVDEAEAAFREAAALANQQPDVGITVNALSSLARLYARTGRDVLARPVFERVVTLAETGPARSTARMTALLDLYNIARRARDEAAASRYALEARADADARGFGGSATYVRVLLAVTNAAIGRQDIAAAEGALQAAETLLPKAAPTNSLLYADVLLARANLAIVRNDSATAVGHIRAAILRWDGAKGADPQQVAAARSRLAEQLDRLDDRRGAWNAGRGGADQMTGIIVGRATHGQQDVLDPQSIAVFETALDTAWAARRR